MKEFNEFVLQERQSKNRRRLDQARSTSEMVLNPPSAQDSGLRNVKLPLSPSIFRRVFGIHPRVHAFHVTDNEGIESLIPIQGQKKSISAFFVMDSKNIRTGVGGDGGVVAELEGNMLGGFAEDVFSRPGSDGMRWIDISQIQLVIPSFSQAFINNLYKSIAVLMKKIVLEVGTKFKFDTTDFKCQYPWDCWMKFSRDIDAIPSNGRIKQHVVKMWMDGSEKIFIKYKKEFSTGMRDYAKSEFSDRSNYTGRGQEFDELVVNEIKIIRIHITESKKMYNDIFVHTSKGMEARPEPNIRTEKFVAMLGTKKIPVMWHKDYDAIQTWTKTHAGPI